MSSLGELFFTLGLDDKKFNDAIEAAKKRVADLSGDAALTVNLDASKIANEIREALNALSGKNTKIDIGVDGKSKANIDELIEKIRNAKAELERLKTSEAWNTSAIERQNGFVKVLEGQLEKANAVRAAVVEANKAVQESAQPNQTIQHVVREEDIELVNKLTSALEKQNEQLELRNRLDQGKMEAAERDKVERAAKAKEAKEQKDIEDAARAANNELKKQQTQFIQLEEGIRRVQNARANIERGKGERDDVYYTRALSILDEYIEKLEKAKVKAGNLTDSEMKSLLGQNLTGQLQMVSSIIQTRNSRSSKERKDFENQLFQIQRLEQAVKKLQNLKIDLDSSDVKKDSEAYKKASNAIDDYINKLKELIQMFGNPRFVRSGMMRKYNVGNLLGADYSRLTTEVGRVIHGQKAFGEEIELNQSKAAALGEVLGQVFNYYMIERFVRNLYIIGGEFQKQQIALQAMIGDVDKANSIFERTKDMAVMSPFTFSELASYTKQMAAYGIEYEELYDTTKRLADISAGVGVDMGRLILAFGQVRSAAVLRGQELRQFTEAGIPMVNELAEAFSNLEKREVKAAEVFDKISRREVSFDMVRDVLFGMTDPGGRFYEMQGKLAESLAGQWSNLKDAWEIMIAEIANGTNGTLNGLASVMRTIVNNWRMWLPIISGVAVGVTALNAGLRITLTLLNSTLITKAAALAAGKWIALASAAVGAAVAIGGVISSLETAEEAQKRLSAEMETSLSKLSENENTANRYLDTLSKQAAKEGDKDELLRRQKLTLEALRTMYGDIVQSTQLEELSAEKILEFRQKIAELTGKQSEGLLQENVDNALKNLLDAQEVLKQREKGEKSVLTTNERGELIKKIVPYSEWEIEQARKSVLSFENLYNQALERQQDYLNRKEDLEQEDLTGWRQKAEELIKGTTLQAPKDDQSMLEYFNYLKEEYDAAKSEFERYAEDNPITAVNKASAKALRDAANRVNVGLGGASFLEKDKPKGKTEAEKEAEKAAKREAKAYLDTLKDELNKIGSQWDLYKQLFEATGNKKMSMNIAFDGQLPNFDSYIDHLKGKMADEIKRRGLGVSVDELLEMGQEGIASKVNDKEAKAWTEDAANSLNAIIDDYNNANLRLKKESVDTFLQIIKESKDFAQQIADVERELQEQLDALSAKSGEIPAEEYVRMRNTLIQKADEKKSSIEFEEFKKTSDWVKVFDDLDGVSNATLDNMIKNIERFARQTDLTQDEVKQLIEALRKLREEAVERNPFKAFKDSWGDLKKLKNAVKGTSNGKTNYTVTFSDGTIKQYSEEEYNYAIQEAFGGLNKSALGVVNKFSAVGQAADMLAGLFGDSANALKIFADVINSTMNSAASGANIGSAFGGAGGLYGAIAGAAIGFVSAAFSAHDKNMQRIIELAETRKKISENISSNLEASLERMMGGVYTLKLDDNTRSYFGKVIESGNNYMEAIADLKNGFNGWMDTLTTLREGTHYSEDTLNTILEALEEDSYYDAQLANLKIQRDEVMKQLSSEQSKGKDEDAAKVEDYKQEIEELNVAIEYFAQDMANTLYGIDFKDWAGQITDSIVEAWANGEDAAKAYEESVSDIMRNVAAKMAQQAIIEQYMNTFLKPFLDEFAAKNGVMDADMYSELANIVDGTGDRIEQVQLFLEELEKVMNEKGLSLKSEMSNSSSLSKGIQSVTEDTANLLGSYLNSIRQDVSVNRTLFEQLVSVSVPRMSMIAEAQLQQLQMVVANTKRNADAADRIYELVNKVVDKGGNKLRV